MNRPAQFKKCSKCGTPITITYQTNNQYTQDCPECVTHLTTRELLIMKWDRRQG